MKPEHPVTWETSGELRADCLNTGRNLTQREPGHRKINDLQA